MNTHGDFASCCTDLTDCVTAPNSFSRQESNGVWYLSVGYMQTEQGPGFFDQAVIFCPFCGQQRQDRDEIARASHAEQPSGVGFSIFATSSTR